MRLKKAMVLITLYWGIVLLTSCREEHFKIIAIEFRGAYIEAVGDEPLHNKYNCTNEFLNDIIFIISYQTEFIAQAGIELTNYCYATTLPSVIDNEIVMSSLELTFDDFFTYNNDTIYPNQNILQYEAIRNEIEFSESNMGFCNNGADLVLDFSDKFIVDSYFQNKIYTVKLMCRTNDEILLESSTEINFNLNNDR